MAKATIKSAVSKDLKSTVVSNPHIKNIHFDASNRHYFNVYKHKDGMFGHIEKTSVVRNGVKVEVAVPLLNTKIVESVSREAIVE